MDVNNSESSPLTRRQSTRNKRVAHIAASRPVRKRGRRSSQTPKVDNAPVVDDMSVKAQQDIDASSPPPILEEDSEQVDNVTDIPGGMNDNDNDNESGIENEDLNQTDTNSNTAPNTDAERSCQEHEKHGSTAFPDQACKISDVDESDFESIQDETLAVTPKEATLGYSVQAVTDIQRGTPTETSAEIITEVSTEASIDTPMEAETDAMEAGATNSLETPMEDLTETLAERPVEGLEGTHVGASAPNYTSIDTSGDVRAPCSEKFFFTREAYETYSFDSFANQIKRLSKNLPKAVPVASTPPKPAGAVEPRNRDFVETLVNSLVNRPAVSHAGIQRPSDMEIAAQAAAQTSGTSSGQNMRYSKFSRKEHARFNQIVATMADPERQVSEDDQAFYDRILIDLRPETEEFIQAQCASIVPTGLYDILDDSVEKIVEKHIALERKRLSLYPNFYKSYKDTTIPIVLHRNPNPPMLRFKKRLARKGQLARFRNEDKFESQTIDMMKSYLVNDSDNSQDDTYYRKKLPPPVSCDTTIEKCVQKEEIDIVVSPGFLLAIVEVHNNHAATMDVPVVVRMNKDTKVKTIYLDRPLPKGKLTAREQNKIYYDWAFRSLCLDWEHRHAVATNDVEYAKAGEKGTDDTNDDKKTNKIRWDDENDENLSYHLWTFGDLKVLIRNQVDGYISPNSQTSKDERFVCLTTKLDYQIQNGMEETVTPVERAQSWILSYIAGQSLTIEGRIDVSRNRLARVARKTMVDIMGDRWRPHQESELMRHLFTELKSLLEPGHYLLQHKKGDRCLSVLKAMDQEEDSKDAEVDLQETCRGKPALGSSTSSFVPAWRGEKDQIRWTFPISD